MKSSRKMVELEQVELQDDGYWWWMDVQFIIYGMINYDG